MLQMTQCSDSLSCTSSQVRRPGRADRSGVPCEAIQSRPLLQRPESRGRGRLVLFPCHRAGVAQSGIKWHRPCMARASPAAPRLTCPAPRCSQSSRGGRASPLRGACEEDSNAWALIDSDRLKAPRNHDPTVLRSNRTTAKKLSGFPYFSK